MGAHIGDLALRCADFRDFGLFEPKVSCFQGMLHDGLIACGLPGPEGVDGRPSPVQHAVLYKALSAALAISPPRASSSGPMAFARTANGRVAGHVPHAVHIKCKAYGIQPQTGGQGASIPTSGAYDSNITFSCIVVHKSLRF